MDEMTDDQRSYFSQALARGLGVIRTLGSAHSSLSVTEVAERADISRAAARRLLMTLRDLGYTDMRDDRWTLRPRILELAHAWAGSRGFHELAQLTLDRAAVLTGHPCSIATLDGSDILFVIRAAPPRLVSIRMDVGSKLPAHTTSLGKVLLAALPSEDALAHLGKTPMRRFTQHTIVATSEFMEHLDAVRSNGYATTWGEFDTEVGSISVLIPGSVGADPMAVNISVHTGSCPREELESRYLGILRSVANEVGAAIRAGAL
jgi:IclR family pca regulon transcriptional regulator